MIVDDIVNSGGSLLKAALTAKNEGLRVTEFFCVCHFENPEAAKKFSGSPFEGVPVRSVFTLSDFGLKRNSARTGGTTSYSAQEELLYGDPVPHFGLVVPKSSPLVADGFLYVAGESGELSKIDPETKLTVWKYSMEKTRFGKNVFSNVADFDEDVCF